MRAAAVATDARRPYRGLRPSHHAQPPTEPAFAIEIPQAVKRRLKRDDERSWIILSELNRTPWPNQDTRVVPGSKPETIVYGQLPEALYNKVRDRWLELVDRRLVKVVARTE